MKYFFYIATLFFALLFVSCKVDFSPNAEWKDIPVVYSVLDIDDDTSWVRVQRCYLNEGDIYSPGKITDSVNYPQDSISVYVDVYSNGVVRNTIQFIYTEINIDSGDFAYTSQPMYYAPTADLLKNADSFALRIERVDGSLLASATTLPVYFDGTGNIVSEPYNSFRQFSFYASASTCPISWYTFRNGRMYEPHVRFYYREGEDTMSVDLKCGVTRQNNTSATTLKMSYPLRTFLDDLKNKLKADPNAKVYIPMVDIYLSVCNEDMNSYFNATSSVGGNSQSSYSNINGGLGLFASRSTHRFRTLPADKNDTPNRGLYYYLRELGVNIVGRTD